VARELGVLWAELIEQIRRDPGTRYNDIDTTQGKSREMGECGVCVDYRRAAGTKRGDRHQR
jgi:hypothetical protein